MGGVYSTSVPPNDGDSSFICMTLHGARTLRIQNASEYVLSSLSNDLGECYKPAHGIAQFQFKASIFLKATSIFSKTSSKSAATQGKMAMLLVCKCMNRLGYNLIISSDLARVIDNATLFFHKTSSERTDAPIICVAPEGLNTVVLLKTDERTRGCIRHAIASSWHLGIKDESHHDVDGEDVFEIECHGNPWFATGENSSSVRKLVLAIIGHLGEINWRMYASINIKGFTDALYFIYDEFYRIAPSDLMMVSLNRSNRLRLINCPDSICHIVHEYLADKWGLNKKDKDYYGAYELNLIGQPWLSTGEESINARNLITQLLPVLQKYGMCLLYTLDISRSVSDKSVFIFCKTQSCDTMSYCCIDLSAACLLRFIGMPPYLRDKLICDVISHYQPGTRESHEKESTHCSFYQMQLNNTPWHPYNFDDTSPLHAKRMFLKIMETLSIHNWQVCASVDASARYHLDKSDKNLSYPIDVNSWILCSDNSCNVTPDQLPPAYYPYFVGTHHLSGDPPPSYSEVMKK